MQESSPAIEEILAEIRAAGRRVTTAKRQLAHVLSSTSEHLTVDELTEAVQRDQPDVSQSTVYRILDELEDLGLVEHSHLGHSAAVYHLSGRAHSHLVCQECGVTLEIPASHFDRLSRTLSEQYGFELDRHHLAISGVCEHCRASRAT